MPLFYLHYLTSISHAYDFRILKVGGVINKGAQMSGDTCRQQNVADLLMLSERTI